MGTVRKLESCMFALPGFATRASYRPAPSTVQWTVDGSRFFCQCIVKAPHFCVELCVRVTWFHGQGNYPLPLRNVPVARFRQRKTPPFLVEFFMFALPIFTASHPATIVGVHELNFCVRDGNRWTLMTINTNSFGWVLPIFYMSKRCPALTASGSYHIFSCLSRASVEVLVTRTGFEPMLKA